ncbi:MAG: response regulator [Desulfobacteraceae bacterium]|nr:response regulator [Desulfobacteraceae bacterium]MBC2719036.1 response regulator [Desulfobacteraceae bacterium]
MDYKKHTKSKTEPIKGRNTILVIEDAKMVMKVNLKILEKLGYGVLGAKAGNEAINVVKTFDGDIDLALLDIVLPDMDGNSLYPFHRNVDEITSPTMHHSFRPFLPDLKSQKY